MRKLFTGAAVATVLALAAGTASASAIDVEVHRGGVLKARAWFDGARNQVCVAAIHSVSGAFAEVWVKEDSTQRVIRHFKDAGGDSAPACRRLDDTEGPEIREGRRPVFFSVRHVDAADNPTPYQRSDVFVTTVWV